VSFIKNKKDA